MKRPFVLALVLGLAAAACQSDKAPDGGGTTLAGPVAEGKALFEQGRLEEALAKLEEAPGDPDSLYYQARVWAKKAETAPLPTPPPLASGGFAAVPEFKAEELRALELFQKAVATRPDHGPAHLGIAELLAPHALRRLEQQKAASGRRSGRRASPPPEPAASAGVDYGPERVINAYQFAVRADPVGTEAPEGLISFGVRSGRLEAAEAGFRVLLQRLREKPEPFSRYGDFLLNQKQDPDAAIEQYRQALIWKPDDAATRSKIGEIYLARGIQYFNRQQFASAEEQLKQAEKWITDPSSAPAQRLRTYRDKLREIRLPAGGR